MVEGAVDVTRLNDAALAIQQAYNSKDSKHVARAIELLKAAANVRASSPLLAVRADQIVLPEQNFISTGLKWLDNMLGGGGRRKELTLIAGVPHSGKTHLLSWLAGQFCIEGMKVLHFNGEDIMGDVVKIYNMMLNDKELQRVFFADASDHTFTLQLIDDVIEALKKDGNAPDVVVVDYMDLIQSSGNTQDCLAVSETTQDLRGLAARHNLMLFTASQLNYAGPNSGRGLARLYRGKVGKASHADMIFLIDDVDGSNYFVTVAKAKGRKMRMKDFTLDVNFDNMEINAVN